MLNLYLLISINTYRFQADASKTLCNSIVHALGKCYCFGLGFECPRAYNGLEFAFDFNETSMLHRHKRFFEFFIGHLLFLFALRAARCALFFDRRATVAVLV